MNIDNVFFKSGYYFICLEDTDNKENILKDKTNVISKIKLIQPDNALPRKKIKLSRDHLSHEEKENTIEQNKTVTIEKLIRQIQATFSKKIFSKKQYLNEIAEDIKQLVEERLNESKPLSTSEIQNIHKILNDPVIKDFFIIGDDENIINPSIQYIFNNLMDSLENFEKYQTCELALQDVQKVLDKWPLESLRLNVCEEEMAIRKKELQKYPIIAARDLLGSKNGLETYILNSCDGSPLWIFKPDFQGMELNSTNKEAAVFEHTASLINEHCQFPVPKTIYIQLKNWYGSAQICIPNSKQINEIDTQAVPQLELQKIIIFDILFANTDRHSSNILFGMKNQPYAIDHDLCFARELRDELRLEYMECLHENSIFANEIISLFSIEFLKKYEVAMQVHEEINPRAIEWMQIAAENLNIWILEQIPISICIDNIQSLWKEYVDAQCIEEISFETDCLDRDFI